MKYNIDSLPTYEEIDVLSSQYPLFSARLGNGRYIMINNDGEDVCGIEFDDISPTANPRFIKVCLDMKTNLFDAKKGSFFSDIWFDSIDLFNSNRIDCPSYIVAHPLTKSSRYYEIYNLEHESLLPIDCPNFDDFVFSDIGIIISVSDKANRVKKYNIIHDSQIVCSEWFNSCRHGKDRLYINYCDGIEIRDRKNPNEVLLPKVKDAVHLLWLGDFSPEYYAFMKNDLWFFNNNPTPFRHLEQVSNTKYVITYQERGNIFDLEAQQFILEKPVKDIVNAFSNGTITTFILKNDDHHIKLLSL